MSIVLIITCVYLYLVFTCEDDMLLYREAIFWPFMRTFTVIDGMEKSKTGYTQRLIYDLIRIYTSNFTRMIILQKPEFDKIYSSLHIVTVILLVTYSIGRENIVKIASNKLVRTFLRLEYQYGKGISYIRLVDRIHSTYPGNFLMIYLGGSIVEAYSTPIGFALEKYMIGESINYPEFVANTKVYTM